MLSRQGTQELGQEDQIDEISSRHCEAVGTECRESPNLTRFHRLAQEPYHGVGTSCRTASPIFARRSSSDLPEGEKFTSRLCLETTYLVTAAVKSAFLSR